MPTALRGSTAGFPAAKPELKVETLTRKSTALPHLFGLWRAMLVMADRILAEAIISSIRIPERYQSVGAFRH